MEIDKDKQSTIEITKVDNGFIVKRKAWDEMDPVTEDGQDNYKEHVVVLEEPVDNTYDDEDLTDKLLFKKLVEYLAEDCYYIYYDKWGKHNLEINFNKVGNKVDTSEETECEP
jgi:hypothetical protein